MRSVPIGDSNSAACTVSIDAHDTTEGEPAGSARIGHPTGCPCAEAAHCAIERAPAPAHHWGVALRSSHRSLAFSALVALLFAASAREATADLAAQARTLVGAGQGVYVEAEDGSV